MLKNLLIVTLLALTSGCATLKSTEQETKINNLTETPHLSSIDCYKLENTYGIWGATSKGLAVLAGLTPATGGAIGVTALVGASSAGVAFYADDRAKAYVLHCTTPKS